MILITGYIQQKYNYRKINFLISDAISATSSNDEPTATSKYEPNEPKSNELPRGKYAQISRKDFPLHVW